MTPRFCTFALSALALALCCCCTAVPSSVTSVAADSSLATPRAFDFQSFFVGEIEVKKIEAQFQGETGRIEVAPLTGRYLLQRDNATQDTVGTYHDNSTSSPLETLNHLSIRVIFDSPSQGSFQTAPLGSDFSDAKTLFRFDFNQIGATAAESKSVSVGSWDTNQRYVFTIDSPPSLSFSISVVPQSGSSSSSATLYHGRVIPVVVEKTFLQKYQSPMLIALFLILNILVKSQKGKETLARMGGAAAQQVAAQGPQPGVAAARPTAAITNGASNGNGAMRKRK